MREVMPYLILLIVLVAACFLAGRKKQVCHARKKKVSLDQLVECNDVNSQRSKKSSREGESWRDLKERQYPSISEDEI